MKFATVDFALAGALLAAPGFAHHGVAPHYDDSRQVTVEGTVAKFEFINPHAFVHVATAGAGGAEEVWTCELASRTVLSRNGLTAETFKVGDPISIEGSAARHKATGCAVRTAYFADGSILRSNELFAPVSTGPPEIPPDPVSIEGVWTMKRFAVSRYEGALTEAGERARAAFDPVADDPAIYCEPGSPVRFWINVNEPFEIRRESGRVVIDHRFMDSQRIVHLREGPPPADLPPSAMGYSTGRFEGAALVVSTDHFITAPLEPRYGVMHTADLELTERLEVNSATGELEITWTIDDPEYFIEPFTQKELFVRTQRELQPYDCKPGYQQ